MQLGSSKVNWGVVVGGSMIVKFKVREKRKVERQERVKA